MKIIIDQERCVGHARCATVSPELFELNDNGYIDSNGFDVPDGMDAQAQRGARACPERIISIVLED